MKGKFDFLFVLPRRYGLLGKKCKDKFGNIGGGLLGGLVGLKKPINHNVPYSITEEFNSVYRLHSLLPDDFHLRDVSVDPDHNKSPPFIHKYLSLPLFFIYSFFFLYFIINVG